MGIQGTSETHRTSIGLVRMSIWLSRQETLMGPSNRSIAARGVLRAVCIAGVVGALVGVPAQASPTAAGPTARAAKTIELVESARLELASEEGSSLTEKGRANGTYNAPVRATFTIHPKSVQALVTVYPHGGSITGSAQANYIVQKSTGYFGGTFTVTRGTGTYRHASGKALGFSGTINRYTFAATVKAHGEVSY